MGFWSIGKIRGRFQPEDFTESQNLKVQDMQTWGAVTRVMFKGWEPREVTISFVVDSVQTTQKDPELNTDSIEANMTGPECPIYDPEKVWAYIQQLQRPYPLPDTIPPIFVYIPGWGKRGDEVQRAFITSASIKRTHIVAGNSGFSIPGTVKAVRATITVTLKEAVFFRTKDEAKTAGQTSFFEEEG
jgi:hypothetical protein